MRVQPAIFAGLARRAPMPRHYAPLINDWEVSTASLRIRNLEGASTTRLALRRASGWRWHCQGSARPWLCQARCSRTRASRRLSSSRAFLLDGFWGEQTRVGRVVPLQRARRRALGATSLLARRRRGRPCPPPAGRCGKD